MLDADLGICLKYKKPEFRLSRPTAATTVFTWKKEREQRAERIRLLYVAMTRAQERMYLAGVGEDKVLWQSPAGEHRVLSAGNYMDWILPALMDAKKLSTGSAQAENPYEIRVFDRFQQPDVENMQSFPQFEEWLDSLLSDTPVEELWKDVSNEPYTSDMQKRSVTGLLRQADREMAEGGGEEEETAGEKRAPRIFTEALDEADLGVLPEFMATPPEKMAAWRGTVLHRFLSLADLDRLRAAGGGIPAEVKKLKEEMTESGVFTEEEGEAIRPRDAAGWFSSPLGRRMLASPDARREWAFNLRIPERRLLVQGMIDCAFLEEDDWVLVDYKTDRVEDEERFTAIYRPQLAWYAKVVSELTEQPVKECWLYSISRQKAYRTDAE